MPITRKLSLLQKENKKIATDVSKSALKKRKSILERIRILLKAAQDDAAESPTEQ